MTTIKKGDTSAEMSLVLAEGFDYAGKTVFVEYQGARRAFSGVVAGGSVAFSFTARETAAMSLGVYPVRVWIEGPGGVVTTAHNAKVRICVSDNPDDVHGGGAIYLDVIGSLHDIEGLPARYTDEDLKAKVNEIIRRLGGTVAALLVCALPALGAGVTVLTAPKGAIYNDQPVVTNVAVDLSGLATSSDVAAAQAAAEGYADAKIAALPPPDFTVSNDTLVATIEATAPAPGNYAAVSNAAMTALHSETDPNVPAWAREATKPTYTTNEISGLSAALAEKRGMTDRSFVRQPQSWNFWTWQALVPGEYKLEEQPSYLAIFYRADSSAEWGEVGYGLLSEDGKSYTPNTLASDFMLLMGVTITKGVHDELALMSDIPNISGKADKADVAAAATAATNYTDSVAGELSTSINQKYAKSSGDQLAQQVSAIGAHLNGEDARFVVTNYDSTTHIPEAYVEVKVSNDWLRVWDEGTRWNKYETWKTNVDAELSFKADRAWGVYDSETGGYSPAGFTQVSSSNILIAAGMAYQRTVTSNGSVWVLQCNQGTAQISGDTNGFFRVMDADGVTQFEIIKGDKREIGCDASGITLSHDTPPIVTVPYSVVSSEHPSLYITESIAAPDWKKEGDENCIATVTWGGSSGAWVATVNPKQNYASMFIRATYEVGGETYIRNNAPVGMDSIILNGVKYYLGTATISGYTVLTLSTTAP